MDCVFGFLEGGSYNECWYSCLGFGFETYCSWISFLFFSRYHLRTSNLTVLTSHPHFVAFRDWLFMLPDIYFSIWLADLSFVRVQIVLRWDLFPFVLIYLRGNLFPFYFFGQGTVYFSSTKLLSPNSAKLKSPPYLFYFFSYT